MVALTRTADLLILDEPTRGIDVGTKADVLALLMGLNVKRINFNGTLANGWSSIVLEAIMSFFIILQSVFAWARNKRK